MARIRNIKPEFFLNEELAELPAETRLAFIGLWTLADWKGRLPERPKRMRLELFPYHPDFDIDNVLSQLSEKRFIKRYAVDGEKYIEISNFTKHQYVSGKEKEKPSMIPEPSQTDTGTIPEPYRNQTGTDPVSTQSCDTTLHNTTPNLKKDSCTEPVSGTVPASAPVDVFVKGKGPYTIDEAEVGMWFPVVGCNDPRGWPLTKAHAKQLRASFKAKFPNGDDMRLEFEKARSWAINNPTRRKTPAGMPSFLNAWIGKSR